jgi:hypothetical protein
VGTPFLTRDEASRVLALSVLVAVLVLVPVARRSFVSSPLTPRPSCADGAHRGVDGRVACGRSTAGRLSARAELLLGTGLDVNAASRADLEVVPRVGPALARRIVEDREARGPFGSIAELDRVPGIGPGLVRAMAPWLRVVRPATTAPPPFGWTPASSRSSALADRGHPDG